MINQLKDLIQSIKPVKTNFELIRVGGNNDGGYLVPNDLEGITACFSPGVDVTASFEKDLLGRGIKSHLADASVDAPPDGLEVASFTKKYLDGVNTEGYMTLSDWMFRNSYSGDDLILQMDIESAEYVTILSTPSEVLCNFRIMAIEIHDVQNWFNNPLAWDIVQTFFHKLLQDFHVVHNHPNNNCQFIDVDGLLMPTVFELTFLRKDRSPATGFCTEFPHPLDMPNVLDKPDRPLPEGMYK
jgi:hypothetical protein